MMQSMVADSGVIMEDTLVASVEAGMGFEIHADEDGVAICQDEAVVYLTYDELVVVADALIAMVYGDDEEDEEDAEYYSFAEDEI
jgi:hypothetical protein